VHAYRPVKRLLASLVVVSLAAACGGGPPSSSGGAQGSKGPTPVPAAITITDYPAGFPTTFKNDADPPDRGLTPVDGGLQGHASGTFRADDGTRGPWTSTWIENRIPANSVDCLGVKYTRVWKGDTPEITIVADFSAWGKATLLTEGRVVVYASSRNGSSPAVCDDQGSGGTFTFVFTNGPSKQLMSGTWHWDDADDLVFDPVGGGPSPSPSHPASSSGSPG
jgi:hypothetical protein